MEGDEASLEQDLQNSSNSLKSKRFDALTETEIYRTVRDINVSKSSGLNNFGSNLVKEAFLALIKEVTFIFSFFFLLHNNLFQKEETYPV